MRHLSLKPGATTKMVFGSEKTERTFKSVDDKLLVDLNGDGKCDEKDGTPVANGKTFSLPVKIAGNEVEYPIQAMHFANGRFMLKSLLALKADVNGTPYLLLDKNMNGIFGELGIDNIAVGKAEPISMEKIIIADGIGKPAKNIYSRSKRPDTYLYGRGVNDDSKLIIEPGANSIKFGARFTLAFSAQRLSKDKPRIKITSVSLVGIAGEHYSATMRTNSKTNNPELWVRTGKTEKMLSAMEYG